MASDLLKFFLDPNGRHGMGDLVLRSLFEAAGESKRQPPGTLVFKREDTTDNLNRLDIVAVSDDLVVGIENKLFHHTRDNPWADYCKHLKRQAAENNGETGKSILAFLLSLKGGKRAPAFENVTFIPVDYRSFIARIKGNLGSKILNTEPRSLAYLLDFMATMENLGQELRIDEWLRDLLLKDNGRCEPIALDLYRSITKLHERLKQQTRDVRKSVHPPKLFGVGFLWGSRDERSEKIFESITYELKTHEHHFAVQAWIGLDGWHVEAFPKSKEQGFDDFVSWLRMVGLSKHLSKDATFITPPGLDLNTDSETVASEVEKILNAVADTVKKAPKKGSRIK